MFAATYAPAGEDLLIVPPPFRVVKSRFNVYKLQYEVYVADESEESNG